METTWATKRSQLSMNPVTLTISVDQADILMAVLKQSELAHPELPGANASMRDVLETLQEARRLK